MELSIENIQPTGEHLLISIYEAVKETASGIIVPESTQAGTPVLGTIVACGEASKYKKGQVVLFRKYSLDELSIADSLGEKKTFNFIEDEEVIAVVTPIVVPVPVTETPIVVPVPVTETAPANANTQ